MANDNHICNYKPTNLPYYYINKCISLRTQHKIISANNIAKDYTTTYVPDNYGVASLSTNEINGIV